MDWATAHRMAMIRASQVSHDTGVEGDEYVDVFAAMTAAQVVCIAKPLDGLAGVYSGQPLDPAIMVNSALGEIPMRHTAAHELAHHAFGHESTLDKQTDPDHGTLGTRLPDEEKLAEAFAAWFLMPPSAVKAAMRRAQISRPSTPEDVHQISCWLGTSFAGTARHLVHLRLAENRQAQAWTRAWHNGSARIRAALARTQESPPGRVWVLGPAADQAVLHVLPGDCLVYPGECRPTTLAPGLEERMPEQLALDPYTLMSVTGALAGPVDLTMCPLSNCAPVHVTLVSPPVRYGIDCVWESPQGPSRPEPEER